MPTRAGQVLNQNLNRNELAKESMKGQYNRAWAGVQGEPLGGGGVILKVCQWIRFLNRTGNGGRSLRPSSTRWQGARGRSGRLRGSIGIITSRVCTGAFAARLRCSGRRRSSNREPGGPVSARRSAG